MHVDMKNEEYNNMRLGGKKYFFVVLMYTK